ncbi:MAG TPA: BON domain-containing protein [Terriglobales bacterium]|jgi:hyperosmotically inducible protein|nr:BON domain-containing protein [Terriglobales bacterium]
MKAMFRVLGSFLVASVLATSLMAQTASAGRYDQSIQAKVEQQLTAKQEFSKVQATVEDGIVTLNGSVDLYQQKLDAAKKVRKTAEVQGVRNLIAVEGKSVPDAELDTQLDRKLYYDRVGYDVAFNYITASVENGNVTLIGEARTQVASDSALALAARMPGVKDVFNDIRVDPTSIFDDQIRVKTLRAIYRDPVLNRYAIDPARPIRILVNNGHISLDGVVATQMDKNVAGIRANQVFGVFSVKNNLEVAKKS